MLILESSDWRYATNQRIAQMTFDEAREIVQRQINLAHTNGMWAPRPHLAKAMEIVLKKAEMYNAMEVKNNGCK